ncbi:tyrosine--tRNA ligase 1 cytoplasmic-like [Prunus yedoensis var. nudiflora]|uniref:tyrosine--tRNA ligase n=1 Tax=Prunus yedoensis var. nudiflora TaxID=2094558 RepID=A0A314YMG6_PRUYE|nr:tyrosine--tRNA ligase 1 cytoplasmic-like [Prunus yedoensis var. nudiflora]
MATEAPEQTLQADGVQSLSISGASPSSSSNPTIYEFGGEVPDVEERGRGIIVGVMKTINVNKTTSAGCRVKIWIADWFAMLNNKMGGDLKKIETVGRYMIEIWRAAGMNLDNGKVEFLWSSKEINAKADEYWPRVMDIAQKNNLKRIIRDREEEREKRRKRRKKEKQRERRREEKKRAERKKKKKKRKR